MLQDLVLSALNQAVTAELAQYDGKKAIFYQQVPAKADVKWTNGQYPHICFNIYWSYDFERNCIGTMETDVYSVKGSNGSEIAGQIQQLGGTFFSDNDFVFCIAIKKWRTKELIDSEQAIERFRLSFDILDFSKQSMDSPNIISGINTFLNNITNGCLLIGFDELEPQFTASAGQSLIYVKSLSNKRLQDIYSASWLQSEIALHIIAETPVLRLTLLEQITRSVLLAGEIGLDNDTRFIVDDIQYSNNNNPLYEPQIKLTGRYIISAPEQECELMNYISVQDNQS